MTNPLKGTHHHGNTMLIQSGPIGLVCLLTAKACGAAHVIVTGEQCVTEWDGGWGLFVIVCVTEWGIITGGHCDKTVMYLKEFVMLTNYPPVQTGHRLDSWTA